MDIRSFFAPKTKTPSTGLTTQDGTTYRLTLNGQVAWEGQMTAREAKTASRLLDRAIHDPTPDVVGMLNAIFTLPKREAEEEDHECEEEEEDHECEEEDCPKCRRGLYCDCMGDRCPYCARK
jgi:hypothetical protein